MRYLSAVLCVLSLFGAQVSAAEVSRAVIIEFRGAIHALSEQYLYRKLAEAERQQADLVIVEIDSPGGVIEPTMRMGARLRDIQWARTVAYIPERALSGGALFALGCDEILLGADAVFGDAGPIFMDKDFLFKHAPEKIRSDLALRVRALAESTGRPAALAEAMVDMDLVVFEVVDQQTGQTVYRTQAELDSAAEPERWQVGAPVFESREGHFLEVTGTRAVELSLGDATVLNRQAVLDRYELASAEVMTWNWTDWTVLILNHPVATGVLFVTGLIALFVEFASPGIGIGGLVASVCFALFFWSRFLGGTAVWLEVVLFGVGLALLAVEAFVLPGFGLWGLSGIILVLASLILAGQSFVVPHSSDELAQLVRGSGIVLVSAVAFLVAAIWLTSRLGSLPLLNRLSIAPPAAGSVSLNTVQTAAPRVSTGELGISDSPLRPAGTARFGEHLHNVVSEGDYIGSGEPIRVIRVEGTRIVVRQATNTG